MDPPQFWNDRLKKFLGFCTSRAMAHFGHAPLRIKRAIRHPSFTRGEVYEIQNYEPVDLAYTGTAAKATSSDNELEL